MPNKQNFREEEIIIIEIFEIEADEDFFRTSHLDEVIINDSKSFLNQNETIKNCRLIDSHKIKTPINEGRVVAELYRTLFFVYQFSYSIHDIFGWAMTTYLQETSFESFTNY